MVERVATGTPGLDSLLGGGFPEGSVTLVTGGAGTGKTIFCTQFLLEGIRRGESGLLITLEEEPEDIIGDAAEFGWPLEECMEQGMLSIQFVNPLEGRGLEDQLEDILERKNVTRVAIDSTSVLGMYSDSQSVVRERLYNIVRTLRRSQATAIVTSEIPDRHKDTLSRHGVEEFVTDGVIVLYYLNTEGDVYRNLEIRKMRRTDHEKGTQPIEIMDTGIVVHQARVPSG